MVTIKAVGFWKDETLIFPEDLQIEHVPMNDMGNEGVYLLHCRVWERFHMAAKEETLLSSEGFLPDVVLYLVHGCNQPESSRPYIVDSVNQGDWEKIRLLFSCPELFHTALLEDGIAPESLSTAVQMAEKGNWSGIIPLLDPEDAEQGRHLLSCSACQRYLYQQLAEVKIVGETIPHPTFFQLRSLLKGRTKPTTLDHISKCAACQTDLEMLRRLLKP